MMNIYDLINRLVKFKINIKKRNWEELRNAEIQLIEALLSYFDKCGIDLPKQETEITIYQLDEMLRDFEYFLEQESKK